MGAFTFTIFNRPSPLPLPITERHLERYVFPWKDFILSYPPPPKQRELENVLPRSMD